MLIHNYSKKKMYLTNKVFYMTERVIQNNFPVPEVIKLKTTKLFGTDILLTKDFLKINFIFQMLSIEKHSNILVGLKTTGSQK